MRNIWIFFVLLLFLQPEIARGEIPFGVSIEKVDVTGSIDLSSQEGSYAYVNGFPGVNNKGTYDGLWDGIKLNSIDYELTFWNVGEEGGTSGMLFWKKNYGDAELVIRYIPGNNGKIWKYNGKFNGMKTYKTEEASEEPEFKEIRYKLKFTGGPWGSFYEVPPYKNKLGKPLTGFISTGGEYVIIVPPESTIKETKKDSNPPLIRMLANEKMKIQGNPWFGWKLEEGNERCETRWSGTTFTDLSGQVEIFPDSDPEDSRIAEMDSKICVLDHIRTEDDSSAMLSFPDLSTFILKPESEIIIESPPERQSKIRLIGGKILANIKKMIRTGEMDITMNQAVAGIKGTILVLEEKEGVSTLKVIRGKVEFTSKADGSKEMVKAGEMISADSKGLSEKKQFDVDKEKAEWPKSLIDSMNDSNSIDDSYGNYIVVLLAIVIIIGAITVYLKKRL